MKLYLEQGERQHRKPQSTYDDPSIASIDDLLEATQIVEALYGYSAVSIGHKHPIVFEAGLVS
jgi:hypothetical protein